MTVLVIPFQQAFDEYCEMITFHVITEKPGPGDLSRKLRSQPFQNTFWHTGPTSEFCHTACI